MMKISVIVPTLNEEKIINKTLSSLLITSDEELIVVDGGSADRTTSIAREFTDKVFTAGKGRGHQMNYGAKRAGGDALLFLHADCIMPENGFGIIRDSLRDVRVSAGAFALKIDHPSPAFRIIEFGANMRSRATAIPYGDQGIFLRKDVFEKAGGFADIPLMEDIELSIRLKKTGKIIFAKPAIKASPRRWLNEGLVYTTLRDWTLALSFSILRIFPHRLLKHYKDVR
ncbi:MAG: glycosyltransferase [Nitrospirae bacterium]|nr:MAG: glycosyltransferase [Nitrospirota bacterium]